MYSADKGYTGRVDAAYISKHGISKSDVIGATKTAGNAVVQGGKAVLRSPLGKPTVQMVANPKAAAKTGVNTLKLAADAAVGSTLKLLGLNSSKKNQTKSKKKRSK
nr:putative ORF1 [Marmot picobirnavirus]